MLSKKDLVLREEDYSLNRKGRREYLKKDKNTAFVRKLNKYLATIVEVPRTRVGERQEIESLINEEAF